MIYLDNAATTLKKPEEVAEAVFEALHTFGNASRGVNEATLTSMCRIEETRELLAELFHFSYPERVIFTMNATESLNLVIKGILDPGDHVITTALEHNSVLRPLYLMEEQGVSLTILPSNRAGQIDYEKMEAAIQENTKAIICTHASNLTGNVLDLERIGKICKKHQIMLIADAAQTAGSLPIDMEKMNLSVLCFTGHKGLYGPQGTGGLCIAPDVVVRPLKSGGTGIQSFLKHQPDVFPEALEAGTLNGHGIAGLHAALLYREKIGSDVIRKKEQQLMWRFYEGVKKIQNVTIYGAFEMKERAPIVSLNIDTYDSAAVSDELMMRFSIATRAGAHCAPLMHEALGTTKQGAVRFSFSYFNESEEIDQAIEAIKILATEER